MFALLLPSEAFLGGLRIIQISDVAFEVAAPFYWVDCHDDVKPETHYYKSGEWIEKPAEEVQPQTIQIENF